MEKRNNERGDIESMKFIPYSNMKFQNLTKLQFEMRSPRILQL